MARTFIRQATQVAHSDVYDDTVAAGVTLETAATTLQDDLNSLRAQIKRALWDDAAGNWYDDIPTVNGKKRGVYDLNVDLNDIEEKKILCRSQVLTDITVTPGQNWELLTAGASEAPSQVAAVLSFQNGAIVAQSSLFDAPFNSHELIEVAGPNAISPKNLCLVRSATTGQTLQSGGRDVYGLLQFESTGANGDAFNDNSGESRVKISFVRLTAGLDDLEACPVVDVAGQTINYSYVFRTSLDAIPEESFLSNGTFTDLSGAVDVTLQRAYENQGSTATNLTTNSTLDLEGPGLVWAVRDDLEASLFRIIEGSAGGTSEIEFGAAVDVFDNNAVVNDFQAGVTVNSGGGRPISVGVSDGMIATVTGDLQVSAASEMYLDDGNQAGSTWAQTIGIKLSDTTAEWTQFETQYGEVSLLRAIYLAGQSGSRRKVVASLTTDVPPNTDISGPSNDNNLDIDLGDLSLGTFTTDYDIYLNGVLLRNGANAASNHDVYPGTSLSDGQLRFEFALKGGVSPDQITVVDWVAS